MPEPKITPKARRVLRLIVAQSRDYDPGSVRISRDGRVSVRKDPDKTFAGYSPNRYFLGYVSDLVALDLRPHEGY